MLPLPFLVKRLNLATSMGVPGTLLYKAVKKGFTAYIKSADEMPVSPMTLASSPMAKH